MNSFNNKQLESMYIKSKNAGNVERAAKYLEILRDRLSNTPSGIKNKLSGLVLEMRDVKEHERDGVSVVEHIKGFWVRENV